MTLNQQMKQGRTLAGKAFKNHQWNWNDMNADISTHWHLSSSLMTRVHFPEFTWFMQSVFLNFPLVSKCSPKHTHKYTNTK